MGSNTDWQASTLKTNDGAELNLYVALPTDRPKAIVQINHGMAEHAGRYGRFAHALVEAGYGAYAHDHRGHGHTKAPGSAQGLFKRARGWDAVIADVHSVNRMITEKHPGVPIICFGHSMGSIIAFNYILKHPQTVHGAALWNAGVETGALTVISKIILKIQKMYKGSDVPSGLAKKLSFETWNKQFAPNRTESDWLSRNKAEVDKYIADPLCGFEITIGMWLDVLQGVTFAADNNNLENLPRDLPINLQAGAKDPCTEGGKTVANIERRMKSAEMTNVSFNLLEDTRHESLNELNREQTTTQLIGWLDKRI